MTEVGKVRNDARARQSAKDATNARRRWSGRSPLTERVKASYGGRRECLTRCRVTADSVLL